MTTTPRETDLMLADELHEFCAAAPHDYPGHNISLFERAEAALRKAAAPEGQTRLFVAGKKYEVADGSEEYETDLRYTFLNILAEKGLYDKDEATFATLPQSSPVVPDQRALDATERELITKSLLESGTVVSELPTRPQAETDDQLQERVMRLLCKHFNRDILERLYAIEIACPNFDFMEFVRDLLAPAPKAPAVDRDDNWLSGYNAGVDAMAAAATLLAPAPGMLEKAIREEIRLIEERYPTGYFDESCRHGAFALQRDRMLRALITPDQTTEGQP